MDERIDGWGDGNVDGGVRVVNKSPMVEKPSGIASFWFLVHPVYTNLLLQTQYMVLIMTKRR